RHLLDGARLQPVLRAAPPGLRAAVALRSGLRPLLPGLPDLADLLRDPHRAQLVVGDAAVDRGAAGVKAFDRLRRCRACANFVRDRGFGLLMLPLSVLPFVAVRGDVIREHDAYLIARNSRAPLAAAPGPALPGRAPAPPLDARDLRRPVVRPPRRRRAARRRGLMKRVALVLALALTALAAPQAHAATACPKPTGLKVVKAGPAKVVLRWRKPRRGPFRVLR